LTYAMCFQEELLSLKNYKWQAYNSWTLSFVFEDPESQTPNPKYFHSSSFNFKAHCHHSTSQESNNKLHHNPLYEIIKSFILVICV
jgi:hypothetical protein